MIHLFIDSNKLCLSFNYNERLVLLAKSIPGAKWNNKMKTWEYPCSALIYKEIKEKFKVTELSMEKELKLRRIDISKYKFKTKPYKHQAEGITYILEKLGFEIND